MRFKNNKKSKIGGVDRKDCSNNDVILEDIQALLAAHEEASSSTPEIELPTLQTEIELEIITLSSTGEGLALSPNKTHVYVVPFVVPGDTVTAKVYWKSDVAPYFMADLVKVISPSSKRDNSLVKCPYFGKCSGCQFQMMSYADQLVHKKTIVEKAFRNFSGLNPNLIPTIGETIRSPLEYGYRTKLTPHFDGPVSGRNDRRKGQAVEWPSVPPIGFMLKNTRKTIDIEDCPIGTDAVRAGMKKERARVAAEINTYQRGATLLLRETTAKISKSDSEVVHEEGTILEDRGDFYLTKTCETRNNALVTEYVGDSVFKNPAGAFFQNNNSILSPFISYIREHILPSKKDSENLWHLVDAYCGSGLFTIALADLFQKSAGIDISSQSIECATHNAKLNKLPDSQVTFMPADASKIFAKTQSFPADSTVVVIDPPRKGCDEPFLRQLLQFGPARVVYVSCNVHSQARDIGMLVGGLKNVDGGAGIGEGAYEIESIRGFDFFPQTGHVEGVAVLRRRSKAEDTTK